MAHTIYHNLQIKAPKAKVFAAISQAKHFENWWPLECSGEPKKGTQYRFFFGEKYNWFGVVDRVQEDDFFSIKMTDADEDWLGSIFSFTLVESKYGVDLEFSHSGWPQCNQHFKIASFSWALLLKGLKDYIEKGIILPFEERS